MLYIHVYEVWREFVWGAIAGAFGEGMMHPVDTIKTRMQSQAIIDGIKVLWQLVNIFRHQSGFSLMLGCKSYADTAVSNVWLLAKFFLFALQYHSYHLGSEEHTTDGAVCLENWWIERYAFLSHYCHFFGYRMCWASFKSSSC